jgi:uncharacterized protein YcfJ
MRPYYKENKMDKRDLSKKAAEIVVGTTVGSFITRALVRQFPSTQKYKLAEMTGALGGYYVAETLRPTTDQICDDFWNRREAKKTR